ncbi:MAG: GrpB family protein, partial [Actinobacteria bacterium]
MTPEEIEVCGLGLTKGVVRLERGVPSWSTVATALIAQITDTLGTQAAAVEHIGSTAVSGLLAKPIVDLAVLLAVD